MGGGPSSSSDDSSSGEGDRDGGLVRVMSFVGS